MDIRIRKTEQAIKNAFIELRSKKPLEKITVKELCELAMINKSTFYSHYEDIYALSETMEQETVASIIRSIGHLKDYTPEKSDIYTRELCLAFMSQISLIRILFSGREQSHLGYRLDTALKEMYLCCDGGTDCPVSETTAVDNVKKQYKRLCILPH